MEQMTAVDTAINSFACFFHVRVGNKWRQIGEDGLLKLLRRTAPNYLLNLQVS